MKRLSCIAPAILLLLTGNSGLTQGCHAINGSPFAGSTGIRNNPAAAVGSAYKWDLTLFSGQLKQSTNTMKLDHFSLSSQDSAVLSFNYGYSSRFVHTNLDMSLFNFHYKLSNSRAIAIGLRARSYNHIKTYPLNSANDIYGFNDFFKQNRSTPFLEGFGTHTSWLETDLNYSQVLHESATGRLSGGVTLQIMKGLSGAFAKLYRFTYTEITNGKDTAYKLISAAGSYGYSSNYDNISAGNSTPTAKEFLKNTSTRFGLSIGVEYLLYEADHDVSDLNNNLNYSWKIGASLMDIGANSFKSSAYSGKFSNLNPNISDTVLAVKLGGIRSVNGLHDTLATIFNTMESVGETFTISIPTRLVINIDKRLGNNFYVNGDLSLNFYSVSSYKKLYTRELNLLTITPRWETLAWGVYLPLQYNTQGQLWVGAAVKLGPLLVGIHNFGLLKKNPELNGGGYLMLSIHPFNKKKVISKLDCPQ